MPKRNSDGRFRNHNQPTVVSADTLRAQWVESEATRLKGTGFSYEAIAQQITQVGRGQKVAVTSLPEGVEFPAEYKITAMGCHKAVRRALRRAPTLEAEEMRRFDTDRCEEMYLFLTAWHSAGRSAKCQSGG
jgi:flavin-dependent dehydrogenase